MDNESLKKIIIPIIFRYLDERHWSVFLFGSRADKTNQMASDIDIGIYGSNEVPAKTLADIRDALSESNLPFFVDVVDFHKTSSEFNSIALEAIEIWHNPENLEKLLQKKASS